jgi:opacity protein-like surface antigen
MKTIWGLLVCSTLLSCIVSAQTPGGQNTAVVVRPAVRLPKNSLSVTAGGALSLSHESLNQFWNAGLDAAIAFYIHINPAVAIGVGIEGGFMQFDTSAFRQKFPGVPVQYADLGLLHLYLGWRYTVGPSARFTPYILADVGAAKLSKAVYQQTIAGKRVTYYEIPGRTRLALGAGVGFAYVVSRSLVIELEGKGLFFNNDPEAGLVVTARAGVRFNIL